MIEKQVIDIRFIILELCSVWKYILLKPDIIYKPMKWFAKQKNGLLSTWNQFVLKGISK